MKAGTPIEVIRTKTVVIFRYWRDIVIALFPEESWNSSDYHCSSYQSTGQHGAADYYGIMGESRPATSDEYSQLKTELESAPYKYNFKVQKRATWRNHEKRHMAAVSASCQTPLSV